MVMGGDKPVGTVAGEQLQAAGGTEDGSARPPTPAPMRVQCHLPEVCTLAEGDRGAVLW